MEIPFLCFKAQAVLFLIPLQAVRHVIPAPQEVQEPSAPDENEAETGEPSAPDECGAEAGEPAVPFSGLWGQSDAGQARYGIVLEEDGGQKTFLVDDVAGLMELPEQAVKELPDEVRSSRNSFIKGMIYIEPLDGWGFVIEPAKIFELEGIER